MLKFGLLLRIEACSYLFANPRLSAHFLSFHKPYLSESYLPGRKNLEAGTPTPPASSKRGQPHSSADQLGRKPHLISVILDTTVDLSIRGHGESG